MGYYIGSAATLKTKIRTESGIGAEIADSDVLDRVFDKALEDVDRLSARIAYSTITTVKDQQDYLVKGNDGSTGNQDMLGVIRVWWHPTTGGWFAQEFGDLGVLGSLSPLAPGLSIWDNPSLAEIYFNKLKQYRKRFGGKWKTVETITSGGGLYIRLQPAPSTAGTVVPYQWVQQRGSSTTEFPLESTIIELATGYLKKHGGEQINIVQATRRAGRSSNFSGDAFITEGNKMVARALSRLRPPPRIRRGSRY